MEQTFYKGGGGQEMERGRPIELPCFVGSLNSLRGGEDLVLVELLVPNNGTAAWVNKHHLTIVRQPAWGDTLRALLRSTFVAEDEEDYTVEIIDRSRARQVQIPKSWLQRELSNYSACEEASG